MAALVSARVQMLLDQPRRPGMMVSCFADTSVSEGFASRWLQPFKTEASRIGRELESDHQARREFERNVEVIRRTAEGASHPREPGPAGESQSGSERRGSGERRLIIDRLTVSDGAVSVDARAIGGPQQTESLPGFDLNEIGTQQGGVPPAEAGRLIITALARDVAVAVAATELERFIGKALGGRAGDALKKGGAEAIHKGLGTVLDQLLRPHKGARDAEHP